MEHEPRGLLGNADGLRQFVTGDAILAITDHPDCRHPLVQAKRGILKDRADFERELLLTAVAEPNPPRLDEGMFLRAAARASDLQIGPAELYSVAESTLGVREVNNCLLKSYGLFHLVFIEQSQLQSQIMPPFICASSILLSMQSN